MNIISLPIPLIAILLALGLLAVKYFYTMRVKVNADRNINQKWIGWYGKTKIIGTSSNWFRQYMKTSNLITLVMWACVCLAVLFYVATKFLNR